MFYGPTGVAISSNGEFSLVTDTINTCVRRIELETGVVTTLAGSSMIGSADGIGSAASFSLGLNGVSISRDASFALVAESYNHCVRRIAIATGNVTTLAGSTQGYVDGVGSWASFNYPTGIAISPDASFALVSDSNNELIRRLTIATGNVATLAGSSFGYADGAGSLASFGSIEGIAISPDGSFALVNDASNIRVRFIVIAAGVVSTTAGSGSLGSADGKGTLALFNHPFGVAISPDASYALIADSDGNRVRHIAIASGVVSTLAGSTQGFADGVGRSAKFSSPCGVAISTDGTYALIADSGNQRIRRAALASPCLAGSYCPAGSSSPTPCAAGTYAPATGLSAPLQCPAGAYCPAGSVSPILCPVGTCNPLQGQAACVQCPVGTYAPTAGLSACQLWPPVTAAPTAAPTPSPGFYTFLAYDSFAICVESACCIHADVRFAF